MKLIVKAQTSKIIEPIKKIFSVEVESMQSIRKIPALVGLTKGDIIVFAGEGDYRRLSVGTAGQVLTADPTAELGVSWQDLS